MKRKISLYLTVVGVCTLAAACQGRQTPQKDIPQTDISVAESTELNAQDQPALESEALQTDALVQGSTQELIYEVEHWEKTYQAEDGASIFKVKLTYPLLIGQTNGYRQINQFFEEWREEKIREYETDDDSVYRSALEVYRESKNVGWLGPWSEEYTIGRVDARGGYLSVLLDSHLREGQNQSMHYRESWLFDLKNGRESSLLHVSKFTEDVWEDFLEKKYLEMVENAPINTYYSDAGKILEDMDWEEIDYYFGDTGVVFYLPPYEIGPYSSGYAEITVPFEVFFEEF